MGHYPHAHFHGLPISGVDPGETQPDCHDFGAVIGAGMFVLTGIAAGMPGPALRTHHRRF
jgi:hypothetical protein